MSTDDPDQFLTRGRFIEAIAAAGALVVSAPLMGEVRRWLRLTFPTHFVWIVGAAIVAAAGVALAATAKRIRDHRARRYALLGLAAAIAILYSRWSALGNPESDTVEHVHFIEYGLVTLLFYRGWRPLGDPGALALPLVAGIGVGTCEEWFQWFIPARVGELRDIFLNVAAIVAGLLFSVAFDPPARWRMGLRRRSIVQLCVVSAIVTALLAGFLHSVHLGHEVVDGEAGRFRSSQDAATLQALSRDRARRWAVDPPLVRPPRLSREDQYMSEGLLHVQERNRRWGAGDATAAWYENRILEEYFAPVLDTPSYVSRTGHRWPAEQRADADRRALHDPVAFVSQAQGAFPIVLWSPTHLWMVAGVIVALLLTCAGLLKRGAPAAATRG